LLAAAQQQPQLHPQQNHQQRSAEHYRQQVAMVIDIWGFTCSTNILLHTHSFSDLEVPVYTKYDL